MERLMGVVGSEGVMEGLIGVVGSEGVRFLIRIKNIFIFVSSSN